MSHVVLGVFGIATLTASVAVKFIGLPDQLRTNHRRKSTHGLSTPYFVLGFVSYLLWMVYGFLQKDWVVVFAQGTGVITMGLVVYQIGLYRGNKT